MAINTKKIGDEQKKCGEGHGKEHGWHSMRKVMTKTIKDHIIPGGNDYGMANGKHVRIDHGCDDGISTGRRRTLLRQAGVGRRVDSTATADDNYGLTIVLSRH